MATAPKPGDWLTAYAQVQRLADRDLLRVLRDAHRDLNRQLEALGRTRGVGAAVRREQLQTIKRAMLREQALVFRRLGDITRARRLEAAARAVTLGGRIDSVLLEAAGRTDQARALRAGLTRGLERSIDVAVARMTGVTIPLSERIYRTQVWMNDRVGRMINSALARGLSAREFAKEARDWFNPNTPGGVRYAALRLARTEINNAFHSISVQKAIEAPWVPAMKWHLSRSHPRPDICDAYAHNSSGRDFPEGTYRTSEVPRKPHPNCFCFVTPVTIGEDEFLDNLIGGRYDDYLDRTLR